MAKFSDATAIGKKYGQSTGDFEKAMDKTLTDITVNWCNEGIDLMAAEIRRKSKTRGGASLAQDMVLRPKEVSDGVEIDTVTGSDYYDYVDKGVQGLKGNKAPGSKYKFKNLGTPAAMVTSFKQYIAAVGITKFNNNKLIGKNKKKQDDRITAAAKQMAVATKIGGIKPMGYIKKAVNPKRQKQLAQDITDGVSEVLKITIINTTK